MEDVRSILITIIGAYEIAILARVLLSWVQMDHNHPIHVFLYRLTEPLLGTLRNLLPRTGMFDLSPLIALLILSFLQQAIQKVY